MTLPDFAPGTIGLIWAEAHGGVIGHDGDMPWHAPADMAHFKATTMGHPVVMGRRTWESIPAKFRPFEGRTNYVLTRDADVADEVRAAGGFVFESLDAALAAAADAPGGDVIWVVGGGSVYAAALEFANVAVITRFDLEVEGDTFAPEPPGDFVQLTSEPPAGFETPAKGPAHRFEVWARV